MISLNGLRDIFFVLALGVFFYTSGRQIQAYKVGLHRRTNIKTCPLGILEDRYKSGTAFVQVTYLLLKCFRS